MNLLATHGRRSERHEPRRTAGRREPDPAAEFLDALYASHWNDLVRYVDGMLKDRQQAEEIAQEAMLRAWRHADRLTPERGSVWAWLCRVARNIMVDRIRRTQSRLVDVDESAATSQAGVVVDHATAVVESVYVARALAQLSPAHREALALVYCENRTCPEAAAVLGVPVGTVKSRVHYALRHLRLVLAE